MNDGNVLQWIDLVYRVLPNRPVFLTLPDLHRLRQVGENRRACEPLDRGRDALVDAAPNRAVKNGGWDSGLRRGQPGNPDALDVLRIVAVVVARQVTGAPPKPVR